MFFVAKCQGVCAGQIFFGEWWKFTIFVAKKYSPIKDMATKPFHYQEMFPLGPDTTEYYHLTSDYVHTETWGGHEFLVVDPEALTVLARQATHDNAFMLRREHNAMVAKILADP